MTIDQSPRESSQPLPQLELRVAHFRDLLTFKIKLAYLFWQITKGKL
jgi:hypothetical protein